MATANRDMRGKIVMVTGATDGIGRATAQGLAERGATVVVVGRNPEKAAATVAAIKADSGNDQISSLIADFESLAQVRQLATAFGEQYPRLDVLINNAGGVWTTRGETQDGFERTLAINHLAPFLLTNLLLDQIVASAPARIINVSSAGHTVAKLDFDGLQSQRRYSGMRAYALSKLANILFTYELARRLRGTHVTANALHPGGVASNFGRNQPGLFPKVMQLVLRFGSTPAQGAETSIYLASSPEVAGVTAKYFAKSKPVRSSPTSYDADAALRLWEISAELVGLPTTRPRSDEVLTAT